MEFIHWNNEISKLGTIIEGDFADISEIKRLSSKNDLIICLGLGCRSIEEIIDGIRKNDKENDYTKEWSGEKIRKHFMDITNKDKCNYNYCNDNNIYYFDTYINREKMFNDIIKIMQIAE